MKAQSKLKKSLDLNEINKENLVRLRSRRETLLFSSAFFVKLGYYSSSEIGKTDLTFDEVNIEMDAMNRKEIMLIKMIERGENEAMWKD